jgi:hypothetical protein
MTQGRPVIESHAWCQLYRDPASIERIVAAERSMPDRARTAAQPTPISFTLEPQMSRRGLRGLRPRIPSPGAQGPPGELT